MVDPHTDAPSEDGPPAPKRSRRLELGLGAVAATVALVLAVAAAAMVAGIVGDDDTDADDEVGRLVVDPDGNPLLAEDRQGESVPTASFEGLDDVTRSLGDYQGRPLVVNFFSTTCVPCVEEMPALEAVHQRVGPEVAFVGLNINDTVAAGRELVEQTGVTYDVGRDPDARLFRSFGAVNLPTTAFVSPDGLILEVVTAQLSDEEIQARIDDLFA